MKICVICQTILEGNQQKYCSNKCKQKAHWNKVKKQNNTYHSQTIRSYVRKLELIEMSGGKCMECGYNKNIAALHLHHRDVNEKEFPLDARSLSNRSWDRLLVEYNKCDLLCGNCHSEHHNPEMDIDNVRIIVEKQLKK